MLKARQMLPSDFMGPAESVPFISSLHRLPLIVHSYLPLHRSTYILKYEPFSNTITPTTKGKGITGVSVHPYHCLVRYNICSIK